MPEPEDHICVGAIAGAFGVKGEARIKSFCAEPKAIADYAPLTSQDGRSFDLTITRSVKEGFAAQLSGVPTREAAEALKGTRLYAPRDRLPALPDDEFYHADLIGLDVFDTGGVSLGRVHAVHDFGAGDLIELENTPERDGRWVMAFTKDTVPIIDIAGGRIVIPPPEEDEDEGPRES